MVRQFQDLYFGGRRQSTVMGLPNLQKVAEAYGLATFSINKIEEAESIITLALETKGPVLVDVRLEQDSGVNPKLVVNRPIEDMSPHLDRKELQEIMLIDLVHEVDVPQ